MNWPIVKIGDICTLMTGGTPKTSVVEYYDGGTVPWIVSGDIHKQEIYECEKKITKLAVENSNARYLPKDSVLIALNGQGKTRGTVALLRIEGATCNQSIVSINPNDKNEIFSDYLFYYLKSQYQQIRNITGDKDRAGLNMPLIRNIDVPLPPPEEQKRIAAILDKVDALRCKRQKAIELSEQFLKSVFLDMFGDSVTNPKGWDEVPLGELLHSIDSGSSPKCDSRQAKNDEWAVLKLGAVTTCQYIESENKAMLPGTSPRVEHEVKSGDLLFTRKNTHALVAACALVNDTPERRLLPDLIFRLNTKESRISKPYLWAVMTNKGKRREIQGLASGAAGSMPNISKANLKTIFVPLPPKDLQVRFDHVYEYVLSMKSKINYSEEFVRNLSKSLSAQAFTGALQEETL